MNSNILWQQLASGNSTLVGNILYPHEDLFVCMKDSKSHALREYQIRCLEKTNTGIKTHLSKFITFSRFN